MFLRVGVTGTGHFPLVSPNHKFEDTNLLLFDWAPFISHWKWNNSFILP